ncbi:hypothetical protein [Paracoccus sp. ME4]|uniref:hypothetical protein n=1 Tax=Paracoccus sp. ME4 TaxID=3138066 RepID=UPI00398B1CB1
MSISLKLDTKAVERLIGDDPETLIDLQRAVVANLVRKSLPKDAGRDIMGMISDAAAGLYREMTSETRQQLADDAAVAEVIRQITTTEIDAAIRQGKNSARGAFGPKLVEHLQSHALDLATKIIDEQLPQLRASIEERLQARFERRLAEMEATFSKQLAGLEGAWKAEAASRIHADVVGRLNQALAAN